MGSLTESAKLPRPAWVDEILGVMHKMPDAVRLAQIAGAERQKVEQVRASRELIIKELHIAQGRIVELELRVTELEQTIIKHLRTNM